MRSGLDDFDVNQIHIKNRLLPKSNWDIFKNAEAKH